MRIICRHGHVAFYPQDIKELSRFCSTFDFTLTLEGDHYIPRELWGLPRFSLVDRAYRNLVGRAQFEGNPWDVMRANGFVFDLRGKKLIEKEKVIIKAEVPRSSHFYLSEMLILQPGSFIEGGRRVMSYDGIYDQDFKRLKVLGYSYD